VKKVAVIVVYQVEKNMPGTVEKREKKIYIDVEDNESIVCFTFPRLA
jgi:hypothetical protein